MNSSYLVLLVNIERTDKITYTLLYINIYKMSIDFTHYHIPEKSGCYIFRDKNNGVIYVGKAKNLKKRVASYFRKDIIDSKTQRLVDGIDSLDFIITPDEVAALLLESKLIKQHKPKYNIILKDDKSFAYIKITDEEFPRVVVVREKNIVSGEKNLFGPYISGDARRETVRLLNKIFLLRVCKKLPKRACILYHLHQCSAPCIKKISKEEYLENVKKAKMVLCGETGELIRILGEEMKNFSKKEQYELAKARRNQIMALKYISKKSGITLRKTYDQDVINYIIDKDSIFIQLFNIHKGVISNRKDYEFSNPSFAKASEGRQESVIGNQGFLEKFIQQYYFANDIPQEIIIPQNFDEQDLIRKYLAVLAKRKVKITVPKAGDKKQLLRVLKENIISKHELGEKNLVELRDVLSLPKYPLVIECFDISNFGKENIAGSMVQFRQGKPDKNNYRRFKIKTVQGQSDFDSIKEVVYRRYYRLKMEKSPLPDLVVIDGGKPQLTAALASLKELGLIIPIIALAKQEEEIYTADAMFPIKLARNNSALLMLQRVRNEAHRFAIKYHRLLRSKKIL